MVESRVKKLGDIIQQTRKQQGLTQQQLAAMANVGVRFVRELEHGKASCHIGKTLSVVAMLGIEIEINGDKL